MKNVLIHHITQKNIYIQRIQTQKLLFFFFSNTGTGGAVAIFSYYLSYVSKVTLDERSAYVIVILIGALFVFAMIAFTMKKLFDLKDKEVMLTRYRTLQMTATGATLFRAIAFAIGIGVSKSGVVFVCLVVMNQGLQAITDFWAALSVTLVIDEVNVMRRKKEGPDAPSVEGRYLGILNTCYSMGVAISSSALLLGLGQSGLDVRDCVEFEDDETLREQCYEADQSQQPYGARMYIRVVYFAVIPILLVCMGLSVSQFPIWGERLRKLELEKSSQESTCMISKKNVHDLKKKKNILHNQKKISQMHTGSRGQSSVDESGGVELSSVGVSSSLSKSSSIVDSG